MTIEYTVEFQKQIKKLKKNNIQIVKKIQKYLTEIEMLENPRTRGKSLMGNLSGIWRYRVGDYRILCRIVDDELIIYALEVGHRKEVYK